MFVNHVHLLPEVVREGATLDGFLPIMDRFGFSGAVVFAPFHGFLDKTDIVPNRWLADEIRGRENIVGFGLLDPTLPPGDQVTEMVDLGFKGVKLHPAVQRFDLYGDWAREAYAAMEEHRLIANFHTGIHGHRIRATCDPLAFDEIAQQYPNMPMIFDHVGGWHFFREMIGVIVNNRRHTNLYAGITSVLDDVNQRYWYLGAEGLEQIRWQVGIDFMTYGLDFPYNQAPQFKRDLEVFESLDWPPADKEQLLGSNLKRLLGLESGSARTVGGDPNPNPKKG